MATTAKEKTQSLLDDPGKDLKAKDEKEVKAPENETEKAPENETEKNPADEVKELKSQVNELAKLLKDALGGIMANAQAAAQAAKPANEENQVTDFTGETRQSDAGTEWDEYETVRTIRARKGMEKSVVVSVNDRNVQIPLDGRAYRLRKPHAQILLDSMEAEIAAEEFAESVPHDAAPESYESLVSQLADLKKKLAEAGIVI